MIQAAVQTEQAMTPVQVAQARVAALQVVREAATELQKNPDTAIAGEAQVAANVADANIAAGQAQIAVVQLQEAGADQADINTAQAAANSAQAQAALANQAADEIYVDGVLDPGRLDEAITDTGTAAELAQTAGQEAISIWEEVAPPEEAPPEELPPEEGPPEEAPPEEVPPEVVAPDTETPEQEVYQEEASPSQ